MDKTIDQTRSILLQPYNPSTWLIRAGKLSHLDYPELAVGDADKTARLCETMLAFMESRKEEGWMLGRGRGFWMRNEEEIALKEQEQQQEELRTALKALKEEAQALQTADLRDTMAQEGKYVPQMYPWLEKKHQMRSEEVIKEINRGIRRGMRVTSNKHPWIEARRCCFDEAEEEDGENDALGIFPIRDIPAHTIVLVDRTSLFGCVGSEDGGKAYGCTKSVHPNLKKDNKTMNLSWVRERGGSYATQTTLFCRVLLACVQRKVESPLDLPEIARLTPTYHQQHTRSFRMESDIIVPNEALQQFGIDIFADHRFDTWVLFTLRARIKNNIWTNATSAGLHPIFSLFNHSCEPNVDWMMDKADHLILHIRSFRDIKAGEQLFVEYDAYAHDKPLASRRARLRSWFPCCNCSRCLREEREAAEAKDAEDVS